MMRRPLMVLLGLGVVLGFGSGFASVARHAHGGCHAGSHGQWGERDGRWGDDWRRSEVPPPAQPRAAAQPQIYIITPQAQAPAPVVVTQAAQPQVQPVVVVPAAAPAAPAAVAPATVAPTPKAP